MSVALVAPGVRAASPPIPAAEAAFVGHLNAVRADQGLPALTVDGELTSIAREWAATMADGRGLAHNPDLRSKVTAAWTRLSENVGYGTEVERIMDDFRNSAIHVNNMIDPGVSRIGVGVVRDSEGYLWTAHDFMGVEPAAAAPAPRPVPVPTPKPRATTKRAPAMSAPATTPTTAPTVAPPPTTPQTTAPPLTTSATPERLPDNVALSADTAPDAAPSTGLTAAAAMILLTLTAAALMANVFDRSLRRRRARR